MITLRTRIAALAELDVVASLFDSYRQFYEQAPDPDAAKNFIRARMQANDTGG